MSRTSTRWARKAKAISCYQNKHRETTQKNCNTFPIEDDYQTQTLSNNQWSCSLYKKIFSEKM